jgi:DNA helicase-4
MKNTKDKNIFRRITYNQLAPAAVKQLKKKVAALDLQIKSTATAKIHQARKKHPRAYEPWQKEENTLLWKALDFTNDLDVLAQSFQRSKSSIAAQAHLLIKQNAPQNHDATSTLSGLNENQKKAVLSDSKRLLVLAGAGSGKTKTLLQKLIYLLEEKSVNAGHILAVTFTRNAANEMVDRLILSADASGDYASILTDKTKNQREKDLARYEYRKKYKWINRLTLKTIHSLCFEIMRNYGVQEFDNKFRLIGKTKELEGRYVRYATNETSTEIFHKLLKEKCASADYLIALKRYILDYIVAKVHIKKSYAQKPHEGKYYISLNGVRVRSKSEQYIANWLYRHGIQFQYEPKVLIDDFPFRPDFYIPEANLYIEHISDRSYPIEGKERQFKIADKILAKTFEREANDTARFNAVLDRIVKNRLPADYHFTVAISFEEEFKSYHKDLKKFLQQTEKVLDMIKVQNTSPQQVLKKAQQDQHERVRDFYKLAIPLIEDFMSYCTNKSYMDFNDMIIKTISLFKNRPEIAEMYREKFKHILVDEFQDVNNLQVDLLKLLLTPENTLFCVGDDWQSIYGFRGSNLDYIVNFKDHFKNAEIVTLSMNYRSTEHIVGASNEVIRQNKMKIDKEVRANKKSERKIHVFAGKEEAENVQYVVEEIKKLYENGYTKEDILFLYRRSKMYQPYRKALFDNRLKVSNKTIHAAKGMEAKAVFVIGLTEGYGGFPDIWMNDRIYQVIKESRQDHLLEEERRLFYVAMTRARDELYLITEVGNESSFLNEIPGTYTIKTSRPFQSVVEKVILCSNCSSRLYDHYSYCPYCGKKQ